MLKRLLAILLVGLAVITTSCGAKSDPEAGRPCDEVMYDLEAVNNKLADPSGTPDDKKASKDKEKLEKELKECSVGAPSDGTAGVEDSDGELTSYPVVDDNGVVLYGDTTSDPRTPASHDAGSKEVMKTWQDAVDRYGSSSWYVEAVNARQGKTGFDWDNDVLKWATAKNVDSRVIHVFTLAYDQHRVNQDLALQARIRSQLGELAGDRSPIVVHGTCISNTRGFGRERVQNFLDCRTMIRVSLAPLVYNEQGQVIALRSDAGIFVDCGNIWWIPRRVVPHGPPPTTVPGTTPTTAPPGTVPPGTVPPGTTPTTAPPGTVPPRVTTTTRPGTTTTTTPRVTTTTVCGHKCASQSPASSDPNDPNENVRPNGTEPQRPPTTAPPPPPTVAPPTTVAPPAPPPPTTAPAPPPDDSCVDPHGVGLCERARAA